MRKFIADEDIPRPIVEKLRDKEFEIFYVEEEIKGSTDREVIEKARNMELPILTFDNDFFKFENHPGIMHITQRTNYNLVAKSVADIADRLEKEELESSVVRINPSKYG